MKQLYSKIIILFFITFYFTNVHGQKQFSENEFQIKALNIILNNFDSIRSINFALYKKTINAKLYYKLYEKTDTLWLKEKITDDFFVREFDIINSDTFIYKKYDKSELKNFNHNSELINTIKKFSIENSQKNIKGDLFITLSNHIKIRENYFVLINLDSEGSIVHGEMLIKFDMNGNPLRIILTQGEE